MPPPHRRPAGVRVWIWGAVAAAVYLAAGASTWPQLPTRLLYEGIAPPLPYRWVRPPANLPEPNESPETGQGSITLGASGSPSTSVVTGDGQAGVILRAGAVAPHAGAPSVEVTITPLDPGTLSPPPGGLQFDGNAYRIEATHPAGGSAALQAPVTVVLRYPRHATMLLRSTGTGWTPLEAHVVPGALQIFASADQLGVFIAAAPEGSTGIPSTTTLAVGAAIVGLALAAFAANRRRRRPPPRTT
ncbi:MAG TPA: hypothetical protein VJT32_05380 [bacterium]|nr:hypothetical protein [bacterium]